MIQSHGQAEYFPCLHGDARHTILFLYFVRPVVKHQKQRTKDPIMWSPACCFFPHFFENHLNALHLCWGKTEESHTRIIVRGYRSGAESIQQMSAFLLFIII